MARHILLAAFGIIAGIAAGLSTDALAAEVEPAVKLAAEPFPLDRVRLLEGVFKRAQDVHCQYLLRLEPDRLLAWFRKEAGLPPKGEVYGSWESEGVAGHSLGHYLSGCAFAYAATGDKRFKERVDYIVEELKTCQEANGDGYVAATPEGKRIFREVAKGEIRTSGFDLNGGWVPLYVMHKVLAGLRDAKEYCGSTEAEKIAVGLADWLEGVLSGLDEEKMQKVLACEHGGMNEVLADLYAATGDSRYLALSRRFHHRAVLDPLAAGEDKLAGLHANTQVPKLIGLARRYELAGEKSDLKAAEFFLERVVNHHSYAIGGNSNGEYFGEPDRLADRLGSNTCETCNTYNMLKLTRQLFCLKPRIELADYYERALLNHILASQNPQTGGVCYYVSLHPGGHKVYSSDGDFWCCVGTGMENHAKYGDSIYFHDEASLYVNLFIASELNWPEKGMTVRLDTEYPKASSARLSFTCAQPVKLKLKIRCPGWAAGPVEIRAGRRRVMGKPGSYVTISRRWKNGETIEIEIPMGLRDIPMPDNSSRVALGYGPMVLAGDLGSVDDPRSGEPDYVPAMVTEGKPLADRVAPLAGEPGCFRSEGAGRPRDVDLRPFHLTHERRYSVYWDLYTRESWERLKEEHRAERERIAKLEAITVDWVQPGEMQPERDHGMKGENTSVGKHLGRAWRHAPGGWFSFDMAVPKDGAASLVCTYWGSDWGNRTFDVLVEGERIATQTLNNNAPGKFFDVVHELPERLTQGRERVTVRFQAHPGNIAGGLFGLRAIKKEE